MKDIIKIFFEEYILPLNQKIQTGELTFFEQGFDKSKDSYYALPMHPSYLYLSNISLENKEELESYLKEFWKNNPELLSMISDLTKLAFKLKEENQEQSADLSPFMYAMY